MKRLAIIPARGGSKRISNKNIRDFCGNPMISYILRSANDSKLFEEIHVSSEDDEILQLVDQLGFRVDFKRPIELAYDHTPIMPVLKYVAEKYEQSGKVFDEVWLLMACSPLIDASDLQAAAKAFDLSLQDKPLLGVSPYPAPIEWAFAMDKDNSRLTPLNPGMFAMRSQDLQTRYYDAGSLAVFPLKLITQSVGAGSDDEFIPFILSRDKSIDIDDEDDWKFAEALFKSRKFHI